VPRTSRRTDRDAIVVGAGPNGLAAAITLARAGRSVLVLEAADTIGGGVRSASVTLPGFVHDLCSSVYPLVAASPFFKTLPLAENGLELIEPPAPLAHPLDDGPPVLLERSVDATARGLCADADAYRRLMMPLVERHSMILEMILGPLRLPRHPFAQASFARLALRSASALAGRWFDGPRARALFAGLAAHAMIPLERRPSAAFGLTLGMLGHAVGWPLARGGAQRLAEALAAIGRELGGEIRTRSPVASLDKLPTARVVLLDVTPRQLLALAGSRLPAAYRRRLERFRYGPGAFKVDWALAEPIPWSAPECSRAGTVHVGGTFEEIAAAEAAVGEGRHADRPFVLVAQPSLFDRDRAPAGRHTAWAYCHVPNGSRVDMTDRIERQIERFAPGFRERVLARHVMAPADLERHNANCIGGDINGGIQDLGQLFARPVPRITPYATPLPWLFLCSSSTPPGGGVHGMCGFWAATAALRRLD
jgi:phytoene dehydrogenase-like protein